MKAMQGTFISFEGPDGAGKTSVLGVIKTRLQAQLGDDLVVTREPGGKGSKIAEAIRDVVLDPAYPDMDVRTEALLYAAARRQHILDTIQPALAAHKVVLSDRYLDSSVAYQGGGRQLGVQTILELNQFATQGLVPDATIYLDIDPEIGLQRIQTTRTDEINRLDQEALAFHQRVTQAYRQLAQAEPQRIKVIDANQPFDQVVAAAWQAVEQVLTEDK
ncbi:thymidylate kinase [Weissella halotolerans DSM 20190]|uniref:Thymidylate kinase n=2 Tax=Weissella halotolerans TaxID=1615 RepID=A0A0R2FVE1_9LACO|nr:thymidylate kinase [Weissella halotolerans DSM 20190]